MRLFFVFLFSISAFLNLSISYGQEYAKIITDNTTYEIEKNDDLIITQNYKIQINSKEGLKFSYFYDYIDKFKKLKKLEVIVRDKTGKKIKSLNKGDGHEYGFNSSYEIDDSKIFVLDPDYQNYPFTIEVTSKSEQTDYLSMPTWLPRNSFNIKVESSNLEIILPINKEIKIKEEFIAPASIQEDSLVKIIKYHAENLEPIDSKIRYSDFYESQPKVIIAPFEFEIEKAKGSFESWQKFGDWFYDLNNDTYELTQDTKNYLNGLDSRNSYETIRKIYHYMQDRTRYVSIQLGIGGYKSIPTAFVDEKGYGDCKALTTYMKNMLDYVGIKSNYILVKAGKDVPDVKKEFPSNQFNHVFLGIPLSDTVFLECTSQISPTYYTGTFTDDRNVLWIDKNKSQIIRSKTYKLEDNVQLNNAQLSIDSEGNGQLNLETINEGVFMEQLFLYKSAANNYISDYQNKDFGYKDFIINSYTLEESDRDSERMRVNFEITIKNFGQKLGDKLIIPKVQLRPLANYIDESELYEYASIPRAIQIVDSVNIIMEEKFYMNQQSKEEVIESEFGKYTQKIIESDKGLICIRSIELKKGDYTKEEYQKFNKFWSKVKRLEKKKMVLNTKT